jgi:hypothetical protein
MEIELNWIAVVLAALSTMVVGSLWYGPLFGKMWTKLAKIKTDPNFGAAQAVPLYLTAFIGSFITALVLAISAFLAHDFYGGSFLTVAIVTGGVLWLGFTAARVNMHDSFEGRPKALTALTVLHEFVTILVMAVIIGVWPA